MRETAVVLAQPHRRGDPDTRRVSALGRFCQRTGCRRELFDSAVDYSNLRRWWGAAVGRPKGFENTTPRGGNGDGPSDATVRGWLSQYSAVDRMIKSSGSDGAQRLAAFIRMVVDDVDPPAGDEAADAILVATLRLVAIHMGRMSGRQSAFD